VREYVVWFANGWKKSRGRFVFFNDNGLKHADLGGRFFRMIGGIYSYLKEKIDLSTRMMYISYQNEQGKWVTNE